MKKVIISITILFTSFLSIYSQDINSLYFLNGWSQRHSLNASFAPENGYFSFPVLGGVTMNLSSNTGLSNFFYTYNNNSVTFLHPSVDTQQFLSSLQPNTILHQGMNLNLFSFGFFTLSNSFWSFDISLKETFDANIPIDFFRLAKSGIQSQTNNVFDLKNLNITQTNIARFSLGYSRDINSHWRVGLNAKILAGLSYEKINYNQFDVNLSNNQYSLSAVGESQIRSEFLSFDTDANGNYDFSKANFDMSKLKPAGLGAAFDLGVTYKPLKKLTFSAALNDIGFINWNATAIKNGTANSNIVFNGFTNTNVDSIDIATQVNKFKEDVNSLIKFKEVPSGNNIIESIPYTLKTSAEYSIFGNDKHDITLGMLWNSYNTPYDHINELVGAVTFKPFTWFSLSTTCEFLRPESNRFGLALNFSPRWINIFVASDYIVPKLNHQNLPVDKFDLNLSIGVSIGIGRPRDTDKDGVVDRLDKCPGTPLGVKVDKNGCPLDTDGDGVPDYLDKCPDTPKEAYGKVDKNGCPLDSDGDGVPDYLDQCPNTPASARGFVNAQGCPKDSDNDGIPDYLDKCPNTPAGVQVDSVGCPIDTDGDGVPDYLDLCPGTPPQAKGFVDKNGCLLDTDGDGVPDYLDKCPGTPLEAHGFTDKNGCILDSDGDGVPDYLDKCPNTPVEARGKVDEHGCPLDIDGDGIPDYLDKCPTIPGVKSNDGCPEIKKEIRALFLKALKGIQFEPGKAVIKKTSLVLLNKIAQVIKSNPSFLIEIRDHTEISGISANNLLLSQNRATAVRNYLIKRGVSERKITANGVGDKIPVERINTLEEKILKQSVEFIVTFER
jgi:outer membrane protein OmpA-like peptidoglycan-associated protein